MLTMFDKLKLTALANKLGNMTKEEALDEAIDNERIISTLSPFDSDTIEHFTRLKDDCVQYALLLEELEKEGKQ
jgi:hypothetical protein